MKLHLESNIAEGTPEELAKYTELLEGGNKYNQLFSFAHEHQPDENTLKGILGSLVKVDSSYTDSTESSTEEDLEEEPPTELQVGDKVKVLKSEGGAVGEATVTAVLEHGKVEIAGTSKSGTYLTNWNSHVVFLEKIEEEEAEEADGLLGYRYWYWYLEGSTFNKFVVLKASTDGYFEDSTGKRYTYQAVSGYVKPVDREDVHVKFDDAEHEGSLLKYYPTLDMFDEV